jgi:PiT family inorganic phosphate transporter
MSPISLEELPTPTRATVSGPVASAHSFPPRPSSPFDDNTPAKTSTRRISRLLFAAVGIVGVVYIIDRLVADLSIVHSPSVYPYVLLGVALLAALGFEFVNGFHDTANAVATVIYTHSLSPGVAVVWSGVWNFVGVLLSSGAVAFSIIALLPPELILKAGRGTGFSMIFALLVSAILWNLGTWYRGLPVSSSHTMIGSVLGVAVANQLRNGHSAANGVDWDQAIKVFKGLVFSPLIGFAAAFVLFLLFKALLRDPRLFKAPEGNKPPPLYIRALLILTCTGVSYAHGSNDGQKGMGLIMLILVGTVPTAYALNNAVDKGSVQPFAQVSTQVAADLQRSVQPNVTVAQSAPELERFIGDHQYKPETTVALEQMVLAIRDEAVGYGSLGNVPPDMHANVRNQMYLVSETFRLVPKFGPQAGLKLDAPAVKTVAAYKAFLDKSTKYIPTWVKVAVALALGLGTMFGWKRIVITVGEKIGKQHLTYAQGAAAELTAMCTIGLATVSGLPVSTTHVLSSAVAGTMSASGSGIRAATVRNIAMAWFFTLPAAAVLSGLLFVIFTKIAS